ncbi:hypothetical protein AWB67_05932 [Caballeronia terrestris]|uniref:Uncharacterized protein n=1 Tax=Caballeronia terrestris TaxID=1226301 RepID=A0A158KLX1_9BURK|nr:hypothetical protein [Caballeronia terrestris]SAL81759.1 hypothetical protein AWB67_05932 [Caballeronia terrestris]
MQLALRDCYETTYRIHDHSQVGPNDALALVAMREAEDSSSGGLLYEQVRRFEERLVYKHFGLNLVQFLELPSDLVRFVLELSLKRQQSNSTTQEAVVGEIQRMANTD